MHAYVDAFSGASGNMFVGALIDLGLDIDELRDLVQRLGLPDCTLTVGRVEIGAIRAVTFDVACPEAQPERTFATIRRMLEGGALPAPVCARAVAIFEALAEAEGSVHGVPPEQVHFHEVGGVDAIADIVGAALGLERLGVTSLHVAPLPLGNGIVDSRHGPLPIPAPATVELLRGFAVKAGDGEGEMVTPTGAAILRGSGAVSAAAPVVRMGRVGYGAGTRRLRDRPNVLRLVLGETEPAAEEMCVVETNVDDMNPEFYEHVRARLEAAGAVDVTLLTAHMKKGRPGVIVQVLAPPARRDDVAAVLFAETTTIGIRYHAVGRVVLARRVERVDTPYGAIDVKISGGPDGPHTISPEYESCRAAAEAHGVALRVVYEAARRAFGA